MQTSLTANGLEPMGIKRECNAVSKLMAVLD